jgi:hypothetical protein
LEKMVDIECSEFHHPSRSERWQNRMYQTIEVVGQFCNGVAGPSESSRIMSS